MKNIHEKINCLTEETNQNELISKKYRKVCTTVNYIEHFLFLGSTITGYVYRSLVGIPVGINSSAIKLKIWAKICRNWRVQVNN